MGRIATLTFALVAALGLGCSRSKPVDLPPPVPARLGALEQGIASWYGHPYHGRRTSNGEVYDMDQLTAAHLALPFDTTVRVTSLDSGKSVEVRINDRGPFVKNRAIDLSREAARRIDMLGPGTASVRIEVVATPAMTRSRLAGALQAAGLAPCDADPYHGVQVGSYRSLESAEKVRQGMQARYGSAALLLAETESGPIYRVIVGRVTGTAAARLLLEQLQTDGVAGFIQRSDAGEALDCS